jgi:putative transposase
MSIARQCDLVGLPRSPSDAQAPGARAAHLTVRHVRETPSTDTPDDGVRRMSAWVRRPGSPGHHKRGARRRRTMGWETLSPPPRMRDPHPAHRGSPSLVRGVPITRGHQGWSTDLTSRRRQGGVISRVAVRDGFRRDVRSWAVSITLDVGFGLEAFHQALAGARPGILHRDQGAPCTRLDFPGRLVAAGIQRRRAGRGRALDNVVVARWWRTVT